MVTVTHRPLLAICCFRNVHNECLKRLLLLLWAWSSPAATLQISSATLQYWLLHPSLKSVSRCYAIIFHLCPSWEAECREEHHSLEVEHMNSKWLLGTFDDKLCHSSCHQCLCVSVFVCAQKLRLFMHNYCTPPREKNNLFYWLILVFVTMYKKFEFRVAFGMSKKVQLLI